MLAAAAEVVSELGYGGMSVARVTARAGVSRRTFYDLFDDREDCFLAVFEEALRRARLVVSEAVSEASSSSGWREQTRAGLAALLMFLEDERALGSLLVVDALGAGPNVLTRRAQELRKLSEIIDKGRAQARNGREPSTLTAEGIVGAVLAVIHARVAEHDERPLIELLLNPLMGMIVLPYLGQAAATKEMSRPLPKIPHPRRKPAKDPLDGLDMRLTYRTLKALTTIADQPGASNREIADTAGVHDQGQISKLLTRLEHLGLIHNTGQGHAKGEANAWRLTPLGEQVEQAIRVDSRSTL